MRDYHVVEYTPRGAFVAVISGMGRNRGKIESAHSLRTAQRQAATLRKENPKMVYKVEHIYGS